VRKDLIQLIANVLGVDVVFPPKNNSYEEYCELQDKLKREGFRFVREMRGDGTIHWYIEQYFSKYSKLIALFPNAINRKWTKTNGRPCENICHWERLPTDFPSMEEAVIDLNDNIRKADVMEVTYYSTVS
jgi:hypothetical protein